MQSGATHSQVVTPLKGHAISWDADDRLWLLRAVEAEGEPRDLVAQTLVNRWAWLWDASPGRYLSLRELIRAYSQPVNPAWFPDGKLFLASIAKLPEAQHARALQKAEMRRDVLSTRTTFSPKTVVAVDQALRGPITIPAGALHFAAPSVASTLPVLVPAFDTNSNVIYGESGGRGSRALYSLSTTGGTAGVSSSARTALVLLALLAFGLGFAQAGRLKG